MSFTTSCFQSCSCPTFPSHFALLLQLSKRKCVLQLYLQGLMSRDQRLQLPHPHLRGTRHKTPPRIKCFTAMDKKSSSFLCRLARILKDILPLCFTSTILCVTRMGKQLFSLNFPLSFDISIPSQLVFIAKGYSNI